MDLKNLAPVEGSRRPRKRVGRGNGSGLGKTCGRGHKGQNSRSGGGVRPGFEGGQMPLHRRLPKRGFSNYPFRKRYALVNIRDLAGFEADAVIDPQALVEAGLVRKLYDGVKILGEGDLGVPLTIRAHRFSKSAVAKIEAAGGKAETVGRKPSADE
jgi:large subunit ribosomal protein L15